MAETERAGGVSSPGKKLACKSGRKQSASADFERCTKHELDLPLEVSARL